MKRIAILGGTFNPIHNGHLSMAHYVYETGLYDEILFMPTGDPPHKDEGTIVDKVHRWRMCEIAIQQTAHYKLSAIEINRLGKTYTVETLLTLKDENPLDDYHLIIGADSLLDLPKWYNKELLFNICQFIVINRPGYENQLEGQLALLRENYGAQIQWVDTPLLNISSTEIRQLHKEGKLISTLVPDLVEKYIQEHHLYSEDYSMDLSELETMLKGKLSDKRFMHSIAVKNTAIDLAKKHKGNVQKAAIAGLLHDCAKAIDNKKKLKLCDKHGIIASYAEIENPDLLHAKLGAILAREKYAVHDIEILDAIECHTTGKPLMTLLDKIIFISDYIEPTRNKAPRLDYLRALSQISIDETLIDILKDTLEYLKLSGKIIDPKTEETYQYYQCYKNSL